MPAFRKSEHVRKRADFELIYKTGFKRSGRLMTMFTRDREAGPARLGIAATKKMGAKLCICNGASQALNQLLPDELLHRVPPNFGHIDCSLPVDREHVCARYARYVSQDFPVARVKDSEAL